jgi:hypothetical protein
LPPFFIEKLLNRKGQRRFGVDFGFFFTGCRCSHGSSAAARDCSDGRAFASAENSTQ